VPGGEQDAWAARRQPSRLVCPGELAFRNVSSESCRTAPEFSGFSCHCFLELPARLQSWFVCLSPDGGTVASGMASQSVGTSAGG
jgi:hypothetical protein